MPKIFISVASFCDPYLIFTIKDALKKAKHPDNLVFGVVDQHPENRREQLKAKLPTATIRYVQMHPIDSRGVCWARSLVFSLYQDEDYLLQIDSHTFFEKGWDAKLIKELTELQTRSTKPIISIYPYGFEFDEKDQPVVKVKVGQKTTLAMRVHPDTDLSDSNVVLRFRAEHIFQREFLPGFHLAGGFIFTLARFIDEVPYDPHLYFHGEEQNLAIRAYTHGWDIFHPPTIPLYHLYKQPNKSYSNHHWHPDWDKQRDYKWADLKAHAHDRLTKLLTHHSLGRYGLGSTRSLEDYAAFSGIDYRNRVVEARARAVPPNKK